MDENLFFGIMTICKNQNHPCKDVDIDSFCSLTRDEISQTKNYYQNLLALETFSGSELLAVISSHRNFIETGHEKMDELLCGNGIVSLFRSKNKRFGKIFEFLKNLATEVFDWAKVF